MRIKSPSPHTGQEKGMAFKNGYQPLDGWEKASYVISVNAEETVNPQTQSIPPIVLTRLELKVITTEELLKPNSSGRT